MTRFVVSVVIFISTIGTLIRHPCLAKDHPAYKLKISYAVLEKNFPLDNRHNGEIQNKINLIPLADKAVEQTLAFHADHVELILAAIRTLYVQGNYYLRSEQFNKAYQKLLQSKALCEKYLVQHQKGTAQQMCLELLETDSKLPAMYSLTLYHLGLIPLYYNDAPFSIEKGEEYLQKALELRQEIDSNPSLYLNVSDNNDVVGDFLIFKRTLGLIYLKTNRLELAESVFEELLENLDPFNQLISQRALFQIYQRKGQLSDNEEIKRTLYGRAMTAAKKCLDLIDNRVGLYMRVSSVFRDLGSLYSDENNPFQDLGAANRMLELAEKHCPSQMSATTSEIMAFQSSLLLKLSQQKKEIAKELKWKNCEKECVDALQLLDETNVQMHNYERLGDLHREKGSLVSASAFYSNGVRTQCSNANDNINALWEKLSLTEKDLLLNYGFEDCALSSAEHKAKLEVYQTALDLVRRKAKESIEGDTIENVYSQISQNYKSLCCMILKDLMQQLGAPPTENYAFLAFGSLGRGFVTPYSDLEYAILLEDEQHKHYFSLLAQLLHLRVIALGESPIASFELKTMEWLKESDCPAKRGFMLDPGNLFAGSCKSDSLSLIGKPIDLAKNINKNHALYTFTHLFGKESLVADYRIALDDFLDEHLDCRAQLAATVMMNDIVRYYQRLELALDQGGSCSIKYYFYRPFTAILDAIALKHGLHAATPWDLLNKLYSGGYLSLDLYQKLIHALNLIGEVRLKAFLTYGWQNHTAFAEEEFLPDSAIKYFIAEEILEELLQPLLLLINKAERCCD